MLKRLIKVSIFVLIYTSSAHATSLSNSKYNNSTNCEISSFCTEKNHSILNQIEFQRRADNTSVRYLLGLGIYNADQIKHNEQPVDVLQDSFIEYVVLGAISGLVIWGFSALFGDSNFNEMPYYVGIGAVFGGVVYITSR